MSSRVVDDIQSPLLSLPAETLLGIVEQLSRNDLLCFMRCCRGLLSICQPLLYQGIDLIYVTTPKRVIPAAIFDAPDRLLNLIKRLSICELDRDLWDEYLDAAGQVNNEANFEDRNIGHFINRLSNDQLTEFIWNFDSFFANPDLDLPFSYVSRSNLTKLTLGISGLDELSRPYQEYNYDLPHLKDLRILEIVKAWDLFIVSQLLDASKNLEVLVLSFRVRSGTLIELTSRWSSEAAAEFYEAIDCQKSDDVVEKIIYSKVYRLTKLKRLNLVGEWLTESLGDFIAENRLETLFLQGCMGFRSIRSKLCQLKLKKISIDDCDCYETLIQLVAHLVPGLEEAHFLLEHREAFTQTQDTMARILSILRKHSALRYLSIIEQNAEGEAGQFNIRLPHGTTCALEDVFKNNTIDEAKVGWEMALEPDNTRGNDYKISSQCKPELASLLSNIRVLHLIPSEYELRERLEALDRADGFKFGPDKDAEIISEGMKTVLRGIASKSITRPRLEYLILGFFGQGARTLRIGWSRIGENQWEPNTEIVSIEREFRDRGSKFRCYEFGSWAKGTLETDVY